MKRKRINARRKIQPGLQAIADENWPDTLRRARAALGFTRPTLAKLIERPLRTVEAWEQGRYEPQFWDRRLIADKLDTLLKETKRAA